MCEWTYGQWARLKSIQLDRGPLSQRVATALGVAHDAGPAASTQDGVAASAALSLSRRCGGGGLVLGAFRRDWRTVGTSRAPRLVQDAPLDRRRGSGSSGDGAALCARVSALDVPPHSCRPPNSFVPAFVDVIICFPDRTAKGRPSSVLDGPDGLLVARACVLAERSDACEVCCSGGAHKQTTSALPRLRPDMTPPGRGGAIVCFFPTPLAPDPICAIPRGSILAVAGPARSNVT